LRECASAKSGARATAIWRQAWYVDRSSLTGLLKCTLDASLTRSSE
jgi:hypothetical protein